jgi:hypothetical protein
VMPSRRTRPAVAHSKHGRSANYYGSTETF